MSLPITAAILLSFVQPAGSADHVAVGNLAVGNPAELRLAQNAPGADAAPSSDAQSAATMGGSPGADAAPVASTPGAGTMTGSPGKDGAPVPSAPGGSTSASPPGR